MQSLSWPAVRRALALVVFSIACEPPPSYFPYAQEPDPRAVEYTVGPGDRLRVRVWRQQELDTEVRVRPDGLMTLPLLGELVAAGRTPSGLATELAERLSAFVKSTGNTVTVEVLETSSYRVPVLGLVSTPGVVQAPHYLKISEAIALAGGPNLLADKARVVLVRTRPNGLVVRIPIRYDLVEQGLAPQQDLVLLRGDSLYVP